LLAGWVALPRAGGLIEGPLAVDGFAGVFLLDMLNS